MRRLLNTLQFKWAWNELQQFDPKPQDLSYIASVVPRGSAIHLMAANKVNSEIGKPYVRGITYPTLIKVLSVAVNAF